MMKRTLIFALSMLFGIATQAQIMKSADLEKYAKERYGDKWLNAAKNLAGTLKLDKNESLTYQQVIEAPGKTKQQLYVALNYWATATFKDKNAIMLNDKDAGCIIISSPIDGIADHTGTLNRYIVSITPVIRIDIKEGRIRVTYTVQNYDILKAEDAGWIGGLLDNSDNRQSHQNVWSDGKRMIDDKTDRRLYDEQWEIAKHYPFVEKDSKKRTCSKALIMTHAYSNAVMDKIEEAIKNGIVGNEDEEW
jgi:hypothetical protein